MAITLGVVMDPISLISYKKDSTMAMLWAAQDRGWTLLYMEQQDIYLQDGLARAQVSELRVFRDPDHWFELGVRRDISLAEPDLILMRKDPPFDMEFLYSTYILEQAEREGTLVINRPRSLRDFNEKLFATQFPQCCPPLLVTRNLSRLKAFHQAQGDVIFKPLDGMGGTGVFRVRESDPNINVILETLTDLGTAQIMAQKYIPQITSGDKRILMIDGEPLDYALARIPAQGESRGNLAAGGSGVGVELTERDRWICSQVSTKLKENGLLFVGLDVIGDYLTEINVTSPTCIRELDNAFSLDIGNRLMDCIALRLRR